MEVVMQRARRVAHWGLWFGGALVLLAALLIGVDVVLRKFFDASIGGADELAGMHSPWERPGRSRPHCSSALTSGSTLCTFCSRVRCDSRSILPAWCCSSASSP